MSFPDTPEGWAAAARFNENARQCRYIRSHGLMRETLAETNAAYEEHMRSRKGGRVSTVRSCIQAALSDLESEMGGSGAGLSELREALELLDNSRETTEKVTTLTRGWRPEASSLTERWAVSNHKARVVLDG